MTTGVILRLRPKLPPLGYETLSTGLPIVQEAERSDVRLIEAAAKDAGPQSVDPFSFFRGVVHR